MPTRQTNVDNLTIDITDDGIATLSGISYDDLRSILTAASLHRHDNRPKATALDGGLDSVVHANNLETFAWDLDNRLILDVLDIKLAKAINPTYNKDDLTNIKASHRYEMSILEETVRKAEVEAVGDRPDPVTEASQLVANALREATQALDKLNRARSRA
jgi:hypothetical protein